MNKVQIFFDYIYYRIYKFFKERGDSISEFSAMLVLSLVQCFTIMDIMVIVKITHDYPFPNKFAFLPLLIVVGVINWYRYERNFDTEKIEGRWKDETPEREIRNGWLLGSYIFVSLMIPVVYGYLHVNLEVI